MYSRTGLATLKTAATWRGSLTTGAVIEMHVLGRAGGGRVRAHADADVGGKDAALQRQQQTASGTLLYIGNTSRRAADGRGLRRRETTRTGRACALRSALCWRLASALWNVCLSVRLSVCPRNSSVRRELATSTTWYVWGDLQATLWWFLTTRAVAVVAWAKKMSKNIFATFITWALSLF